MVDDEIEYETISSYIERKSLWHVYYAKDIPIQIRLTGELTQEEIGRAEELDTLSHLQRLQRGTDDWNLWVKVYAERWLNYTTRNDAHYWTWLPIEDVDYNWREIDFHPNRPSDMSQDVSFKIDHMEATQSVFPFSVDFSGAIFAEAASFSQAIFVGRARFCVSNFYEDVGFYAAHFRSAANFEGATFGGRAAFENAIFYSSVAFTSATFVSYVYFTNVDLRGNCDFSGVVFDKLTYFRGTSFGGPTSFGKTLRGNRTHVFGDTFVAQLSTDGAIFSQTSYWENCKFKNTVDFFGSYFLRDTSFRNVRFERYASFDHVWFGTMIQTPKPGQYSFWHADRQAQYDAAQVDSKSLTVPDFKGATFEVAPNLGYTYVARPPAPLLPVLWRKVIGFLVVGLDFDDVKIADGDAAAKLRVLGELASRGHHHLAEKRFFRTELLCKREHEANTLRENTMITLFELFSGCGLSFWRPIIWLLGLMVASAAFYYTQIDWPAGDGGWFELASYSFANSLPLLGYISDSYGVSVDVLFGGIDRVPGPVRVWAFMQNVVSAILIFFGLLAIRNYFKLG